MSGKLFPILMEHLSNAKIVVKSAERHCMHVQLKIYFTKGEKIVIK